MTAQESRPTVEVTERAITWADRARAVRIINQETYDRACDELRGIKALRDEVEQTFGPIVKAAYAAHHEAVAQRKKADAPLDEAERILKRAIGDYSAELERRRLEAQRALEVEAKRLQDEQLEREIEEAESQGATAPEIEAMIERGPSVPAATPPIVQPTIRPSSGVSTRELWKADVTDLIALVKYVAANPQFVGLLQANQTAIGAMARSLKSTMRIPGVRVWNEGAVAVRRG